MTPPPFLFRSNLNGTLKPSILNYETGKESSNFVSVSIKISMSCISISFFLSNLFLIELIYNHLRITGQEGGSCVMSQSHVTKMSGSYPSKLDDEMVHSHFGIQLKQQKVLHGKEVQHDPKRHHEGNPSRNKLLSKHYHIKDYCLLKIITKYSFHIQIIVNQITFGRDVCESKGKCKVQC